MKIEVSLDEAAPDRLRRAFGALPGVAVRVGAFNEIDVDGARRTFVPLPRPQTELGLLKAIESLTRNVPKGTLGVVIAGTVPEHEREAIEAAGLSWWDGRGAIHLTWPGVYVHIDRAAKRGGHVAPAGGNELGPVGIRAVQVLLSSADGEWTVARLAAEAAMSVGQAHKVLQVLEREGLMTSRGKGPTQRRAWSDRRAALDWLAGIDGARRRPVSAATYLYGRTIDDVIQRFAARAQSAGLPYAVTAAAGAHLYRASVVSRIVVVDVRVPDAIGALARLELEHLEAEDAGRGANLALWTDTGALGLHHAEALGDVVTAPPIRVWLDLARQGGRGADAAQLFREQVVERA